MDIPRERCGRSKDLCCDGGSPQPRLQRERPCRRGGRRNWRRLSFADAAAPSTRTTITFWLRGARVGGDRRNSLRQQQRHAC